MGEKTKKKLIEVALPLEAINQASAREKSIRHGHPSTLHLWWARRPLAAARAVIFAQMVDDPSAYSDELFVDPAKRRAAEKLYQEQILAWDELKKTIDPAPGTFTPGPKPTLEEVAVQLERQRLFRLIEDLVKWENTTNEPLLEKARAEISKSWARWCRHSGEDSQKLPPFHDPFAGGGSLPLEAQRLGLEAHASDLNPVAVMINKAMIEIPPRFSGAPPVNPRARRKIGATAGWKGAAGLADDVRYYGEWMREEAQKRIGHLYPQATRADGRKAKVIAWLWARTVESPNPAFRGCHVPLISSFWLSSKPGKEVWVEPVVEGKTYLFNVKTGKPKDKSVIDAGTKFGRGANFKCLLSDSPLSADYIRKEAQSGRMGARMMAIVSEGDRGRHYLPPTVDHEEIARSATPTWKPDQKVTTPCHDVDRLPMYGMPTWGDAFTLRQLVALTTFSDLVAEVRERVRTDSFDAGLPDDSTPLRDGGFGAKAYAEAVSVYLAFVVDKCTDYWSSISTWVSGGEFIRNTFSRQAISMVWDYVECNPFSDFTGSWIAMIDWVCKVMSVFPALDFGIAYQSDAVNSNQVVNKCISTDPPYYDNIGYADLSDFFYVWLRHNLQTIYPDLFSTLLVPKVEELVATPYRHGSKANAESFFLEGMSRAIHKLAELAHPAFPVTVYYAFKQAESDRYGISSTGWETFLEAVVIRAGFSLTGTWPMRTERPGKITANTNILASSIVLVCRPRSADAPVTTRRDFLAALKREMPKALRNLQQGNIAPVDLAQANIGPGMAIFSQYAKILEADGSPMKVRTALAIINQILDELLAEQEGDFDADTGWAVAWFDQFAFNEGPFGEAETLCKAKNTSVTGLEQDGIVKSGGGRVRLLRVDELPSEWDPSADKRLTIWETTHHLIRALKEGESEAAALLSRLGVVAESARELAYRLYNICERRKRSQEAQDYNALVLSWPEISRLAREQRETPETQTELF